MKEDGSLMANEVISVALNKEFQVSVTANSTGKNLPQSSNNELGTSFAQSLMKVTQVWPAGISVNNNTITPTEELSAVARPKNLASAMPLLIQALEQLEDESSQVAQIYNQVTINNGVLTKANILELADLKEKIATTKAEIETIMSPLDQNESQTKQLSVLLLPVFETIDAELETLQKFNKKAAEQLADIEANNGHQAHDFAIKLSQDSFELIDQEKRLLPFSFAADDLTVINRFLNRNFNGDNVVSVQQGIENTQEFKVSFEKYQEDRNEAYFAQRKLRITQYS